MISFNLDKFDECQQHPRALSTGTLRLASLDTTAYEVCLECSGGDIPDHRLVPQHTFYSAFVAHAQTAIIVGSMNVSAYSHVVRLMLVWTSMVN